MVDQQEEAKLRYERRFAAIEQNVAVILSNCATKEDMARLETRIAHMETQMAHMETRLIKGVIGAMAASMVGVIGTAASILKPFIS